MAGTTGTQTKNQIIVPEVVQGYMDRLAEVIVKLDDAKLIVDNDVLAPLSTDADNGASASIYYGNASTDLVDYFEELSKDINRLANMVYKLYLYMDYNIDQARTINASAQNAVLANKSSKGGGVAGGALGAAVGAGVNQAMLMLQ